MTRRLRARFFAALSLICALCLLSGCAIFEKDSAGSASAPSDSSEAFTYAAGIFVSDVDLSGMTEEEAKRALSEAEAELEERYRVTASYGGETLTVTASDLVIEFNTDEVLQEAAVYSTTYPKALASDGTPAGKTYTLTPTLRYGMLESKIAEFAENLSEDPVEPDIADFDFDTLTFTYTDGKDGRAVDTEALEAAIIQTLESDTHSGEIEVPVSAVPFTTTLESLQAKTGKVASFSTESTNGGNANQNMKKAMGLLDRQTIPAGGIFSFHEFVGNSMDESLGWLPAGAWKDGKLIQESGGGICQAATTIYGCALRANMAIIERYCHLRPSSYAPEGLDATVDYPYVDLRLQNVTAYPIYLSAAMEDNRLTATIYGYITDEFDKIEVGSKRTETIPMPDAEYEEDDSLKKGEVELDRTGYEGIKAVAWRIYYKNGEEVRREDLPDSYYSEVAPLYKVGPEPTSMRSAKNED